MFSNPYKFSPAKRKEGYKIIVSIDIVVFCDVTPCSVVDSTDTIVLAV
jgi:hypothetical protein